VYLYRYPVIATTAEDIVGKCNKIVGAINNHNHKKKTMTEED